MLGGSEVGMEGGRERGREGERERWREREGERDRGSPQLGGSEVRPATLQVVDLQ